MFSIFALIVVQVSPFASPSPLPTSPTGKPEIAVRKDSAGRVVECRIVKSSGNAMTDRDACRAAVRVKPSRTI